MIENFLSENNCIISNKIIKPTPVLPNYIVFADPEIERICIENWSSDRIGLTYEDAAAVIDLNNNFYENESIVFFDELQYFTNLTLIGSSAFDGCTGLTSITIPNSVTSIGENIFNDCTGLTSITSENINPPIMNGFALSPIPLENIYVPSESVDAYKAAAGWSEYAEIITAIIKPT